MRAFWCGLAIFLFGGVLGTGFGVALGFQVFPPPPANEQLTQSGVAPLTGAAQQPAPSMSAPPVATGTFIRANPSDPIHWGKGKVSAYDRTVFRQCPDSEVGPGPKFHVYLVPKANVRREADVKDEMFVDLGRQRAFKGSQCGGSEIPFILAASSPREFLNQNHTRIVTLLVPFDSEVRLRGCCRMKRTSESGHQRYPIPEGVDVKTYASVVIWCEHFGVLIAPADLMLAKRQAWLAQFYVTLSQV